MSVKLALASLGVVAGLIATSASAQVLTPRPEGKPPVAVTVRAQGTGDPHSALHSLVCHEDRFCTSVFDVNRRRTDRDPNKPAPPPVRIEIGVLVRPDGAVIVVPAMQGTKLQLNCLASQTVQLKPATEATRIRFVVHEEDAVCAGAVAGKPAPSVPAEKGVASIEVVVRTVGARERAI